MSSRRVPIKLVALCRLGLLLFGLCAMQASEAQRRDYSGYAVIRGQPQTITQLEHLRTLMLESVNTYSSTLQFWTEPNALNQTVDILADKRGQALLEHKFCKWNMPSQRMIEDVGRAIARTRTGGSDFLDVNRAHIASNETLNRQLRPRHFYTQFQRYAAIEAKLKQLEQLDPRVELEVIGKSYEKRNLYLVKVSSDSKARKPIILIDAGHHAREWISHSTVVYLIESLVNIDVPRMSQQFCKHDKCRRETRVDRTKLDLDKYDFWFIPVVNPDGYEYSHTTDRLWRKTRSGSYCRGVDANRNYPFHWNESGASSYLCSDIYSGPRARSEPEVNAVISVMDNNRERIAMYVSFHCYSQLILVPYGYRRVYPSNYQQLERVANSWIESMGRLRDTRYRFGTSAITLYPAAGGSDDYAHSIGIPLVYTVELPDEGKNGFMMPESEIIPVGHETLIGLRSMIDSIDNANSDSDPTNDVDD